MIDGLDRQGGGLSLNVYSASVQTESNHLKIQLKWAGEQDGRACHVEVLDLIKKQ